MTHHIKKAVVGVGTTYTEKCEDRECQYPHKGQWECPACHAGVDPEWKVCRYCGFNADLEEWEDKA